MKKRPPDENLMIEIHAARRFHELLRHDHARDAQWRKDQAKVRARADRKAARIDGLVRTAELRIAGCKNNPTPLGVRQLRKIVDDSTEPAQVRVKAAAKILEWSES